MTKYLLLIFMSLQAFAAQPQQGCPLVPVRLVQSHAGKCVRTVGIVTLIRRLDAGIYTADIADKRNNVIRAIVRDEPYTGELVEVWGNVGNDVIPWIESARFVVIKSKARKRCNPCTGR